MPGIFGFVANEIAGGNGEIMSRMAEELKEEPWHLSHHYVGEDYGLGHVSLGIVNELPQPIWNEDKSICIVMEGEVFGRSDLTRLLIRRGHIFNEKSDAEFILHLFEEYGRNFTAKLNGNFVAAIWEAQEKKLWLVNDRLGSLPLYYCLHPQRFIVASRLGALLTDPHTPRRIDSTAVAQLMTFEHMLGERTLLQDVYLLPAATLACFHEGKITLSPYWQLKLPQTYQSCSIEDYIDGLIDYLRKSIAKQAPNGLTASVMLSGGLDSRVILGFLVEENLKSDFDTLTFGIAGSTDAQFAREIARNLKIKNHFYEIEPDFLPRVVNLGVRVTNGMFGCNHWTVLSPIELGAYKHQLYYKGYFGDALLGYYSNPLLLSYYTRETLINHVFLNNYSILFPPNVHRDLFSKDFYSRVEGVAIRSLLDMVPEDGQMLALDFFYGFDLMQRQRRFTLNGVELARSQAVIRVPFCDNDLIDYVLQLPPGLRVDRSLIKKAMIKTFPALCKTPFTDTNAPLIDCARDLFIRIDRQTRWWLRKAGLSWLTISQNHHFTDYGFWMRTTLKSWVEDILLNPQALDRGYFQPEYIQKLVGEHMNGTNHTDRIGTLLAMELWHKQYLD